MGLTLGDIDKQSGGDQKLVSRAKLSLGIIDKASEETGVDLTKGLLECGVLIDSSYSLKHAYDDGSIQETGERALAWIAPVDNNGEFEVGFWDDEAHDPTNLNLGNYRGWVRANQPELGGTNLYDAIVAGAKMAADALKAPKILDLIATKRFGTGYKLELKDLKPVRADKIFHLTIITDGAPNRGPRPYHEAIKELIVRLSYAGIFIKFIFVGDDEAGREFLQLLDDMAVAKHSNDPWDPSEHTADDKPDVDWFPGVRYIDNVDKVEFERGLANVTDEEFAQAMTQELPTYVPSAYRRDLVSNVNLVGV